MKNYRLTPVTNIGTNIPNEILTNFQWYVKYIIHHGQERLSPEIQNDLTLEICLIDHSSIIKETLHLYLEKDLVKYLTLCKVEIDRNFPTLMSVCTLPTWTNKLIGKTY